MDYCTSQHCAPTKQLFSILATILIAASGCGNEDGYSALSSAGTNGSITFSLDFGDAPTARMAIMSSAVDICQSFEIQTITASVQYPDQTVISSGSWPCTAHTGQLSDIPAESGLILWVEALVSGQILYRGQRSGIQVLSQQNTHVGAVAMAYVGALNQYPLADAGPDQTVDEGQRVALNGSNSIDPDDGIASFRWRQTQGEEVALINADEADADFIAPVVGVPGEALVFELEVTDYSGAASNDSCIINVTWVNNPPSANAGADQTVEEGVTVTLDASRSSDPDDGIASYAWAQQSGPSVFLSDPLSVKPIFPAPVVGPGGTSLTFEVTVIDAGGLQDTDTCSVNITNKNASPTAVAVCPDQVVAGGTVTLNGSQSFDVEDPEISSFRWNQTDGIPVTLSDSTAEQPEFTAPDAGIDGALLQFRLTVTDSAELTGTDTCHVQVIPAAVPLEDTAPPVVVIQEPQGNPLTVRSKNISFSGIAWDDREVVEVAWQNSAGDDGIAEGTSEWFIARIKLDDGINVITISAYDAARNKGTASKIVYLEEEKEKEEEDDN